MNSNDIDNFLAEQDLPNLVALATNGTDILYEGAFGKLNTATGESVEIETPYAIMSMTKPITSFAIMQLVDRGLIDLDVPAARYLPKYEGKEVLATADVVKQTVTTAGQTAPFTVRQLLTHTAGFGYAFCNETLDAFMPEGGKAAFPLCHQPGEAWTYGMSTRLLGDIVASLMDKDLGAALDELIFTPLEMNSTSFELKDNQVFPHRKENGIWVPQDKMPMIPFGDGGLISTARDYAKFLRCLLAQGQPLLSASSFSAMISNQIGNLFVTEQPAADPIQTHPFPTGAGIDKWGLGFQLHQQPESGMRSAGSYSWCGLLNTYFWGDPIKGVAGVLFSQFLPLYDPAIRQALDGFEKRFYKTL
jgi:methyl acetate hydrolase